MIKENGKIKFFLPIFLMALCVFNSSCTHFVLATSGNKLTDTEHGKRTLGSFIEDQSIEIKTLVNLKNSDPAFLNSHIIVVSYDGYLLLTGQTPSASFKHKAGEVAKKIRHVERVYNEIKIAKPTSVLTRLKDTWLTKKIKFSLLLSMEVPGRHCKIVTENGTVYLMGLLSEKESEKAIQIIKRASGVQEIVRLVEYID